MRNESPVGLATFLGLLPAAAAAVVFVVLLVMNGGDVEAAVALTVAIIGGVSLVGTAALRQWRAVAAARSDVAAKADPTDPEEAGGGELTAEQVAAAFAAEHRAG